MKLSAVISASNEATMLKPGLELLGFCDEIVVVIDDKSTDDTEKIAKQFTKKVFVRKFDTFSQQKNFAMNKASGEWILIVDADERITPALAKEIRSKIESEGKEVGYQIRFNNFYLGKNIKHGGWNDNHIRVFKKSHGHYVGDIHERLEIDGKISQIKEQIWHFSHRSVTDMLAKTINFGEVQSEEMLKQGHPRVTARSLYKVVTKEFSFRMIRSRAYKDGIEGVIEAMYQAFSLFSVYVMLWQKQRRPSLERSYQKLEQEAKRKK